MRPNTSEPMPSADSSEPDARRSPTSARGLPALRDAGQRPDDDHGRDREVDAERPSPGVDRREEPADQRADRGHRADHGPVDREGHGPARAPVGRVDQRERARRHHGAADPLQGPGRDQQAAGLADPASTLATAKTTAPDDEHPAASDPVPHASGDDEEHREHQRVDGLHPLGVHGADVQVGDDRRERDVDDRRVHDDHRQTEGDEDHRGPADLGCVGTVVCPGHSSI